MSDDDSRSCVLVVEDNADLQTFVANLLGAQYRVIVAGDGHTGLPRQFVIYEMD